jgi:hypothetical protein
MGATRSVEGFINYFGSAPEKPTFHAQDLSRDNWQPDRRKILFHDARMFRDAPTLEREGIALVPHKTAVKDFRDREEVAGLYGDDLADLIRRVTGAKYAVGFGIAHMRFSPRRPEYKRSANTHPAHLPHIDVTPKTAPGLSPNTFFTEKVETLKPGQRLVGYNVWRVVSEPPQDWPLAVCDARTVDWGDLVEADGVYDIGEGPWLRAEAYMVRYNPAHRWLFFSDMRPDEALIFRAYESSYEDIEAGLPGVPHVAFEDPTCPPEVGGRVSIEARAYAIFDE